MYLGIWPRQYCYTTFFVCILQIEFVNHFPFNRIGSDRFMSITAIFALVIFGLIAFFSLSEQLKIQRIKEKGTLYKSKIHSFNKTINQVGYSKFENAQYPVLEYYDKKGNPKFAYLEQYISAYKNYNVNQVVMMYEYEGVFYLKDEIILEKSGLSPFSIIITFLLLVFLVVYYLEKIP